MAKPHAEGLETFLRRQDAADLVAVLLDLAKDHDAVQARIAHMQIADRPADALAWPRYRWGHLDDGPRHQRPWILPRLRAFRGRRRLVRPEDAASRPDSNLQPMTIPRPGCRL